MLDFVWNRKRIETFSRKVELLRDSENDFHFFFSLYFRNLFECINHIDVKMSVTYVKDMFFLFCFCKLEGKNMCIWQFDEIRQRKCINWGKSIILLYAVTIAILRHSRWNDSHKGVALRFMLLSLSTSDRLSYNKSGVHLSVSRNFHRWSARNLIQIAFRLLKLVQHLHIG